MERLELKLTKDHRGGSGSRTFSGRPQGEGVRLNLDIDKKDNAPSSYKITLPDDTTSFNPSFYLGLFYPSIKKLGGIEQFKKKYEFDLSNIASQELRDIVQANIAECERKAGNECAGKTGLDK